MSIWMNFLLDAPIDERQRAVFASVLDSATRNEIMQGDGISGIASGTFEVAFSANRWTVNKLMCALQASFCIV